MSGMMSLWKMRNKAPWWPLYAHGQWISPALQSFIVYPGENPLMPKKIWIDLRDQNKIKLTRNRKLL